MNKGVTMRTLAMIGILAAALAAGAFTNVEKSKPQAAAPPGKAAPAKPAPAAPPGSVTGTVLETMDSGGYTYMKLKTEAGEVWSAVGQTKVRKGQTVTIASPMMMENFESKTLHRKFDQILFGSLAESPAQGSSGNQSKGLPPGHPAPSTDSMQAMVAAQHAAAANPAVDSAPIKVARAEGAEGRTVAQLFAERADLKDKPVAVRGKVVKVTPEVMGKNWLHLRDGSGSREKKDDDITITTTATAAVGDVVVARGVVHLDRDFGAGYTYSVIIEDAKVTK
jgi:hypothetical protein